ncbi:hypothetical protein GUJ93_ZPchr0007g4931 [Zizania palustris]|uniref:Uncharacterized protein n=1 Tax=Zizania palustris TaxID=103762 RepID=A0A8J5SNN3_ZIZPA|nr:hypothetical protein GUJ93_ZPchr0007g4931 [Zizania palustris]
MEAKRNSVILQYRRALPYRWVPFACRFHKFLVVSDPSPLTPPHVCLPPAAAVAIVPISATHPSSSHRHTSGRRRAIPFPLLAELRLGFLHHTPCAFPIGCSPVTPTVRCLSSRRRSVAAEAQA